MRNAKLLLCCFRGEPTCFEPTRTLSLSINEQPHPYDGTHLPNPNIRIRLTSREDWNRESARTTNMIVLTYVHTASCIQAIKSWIASTFPPNQPRPAFQNTGLDSVELSSADKAVLHLVSIQMGGLL